MAFASIPLGRGLYTAADARAVPPGMAQAMNNVNLDRDPGGRPIGMKVRRGYYQYAQILGETSGIIQGGIEYRSGYTSSELLWALADGTLRKGNFGTLVATIPGRGGNPWEFVALLDPDDGVHKCYFVPGWGLWTYNTGAGVKELKGAANVYSPNVLADPPEEPNRLADTADNIHFATVLGTAWNGLAVAQKDRVYFSHPLKLDYFPENSYWDVVTDHNDWISAIYGGIRGSVVIAKEGSVFVLRGTTFDDSYLVPISANIGCPSAKTLCPAEDIEGVVFQGSDGHVYALQPDSGRLTCLSEEIAPTLAAAKAAGGLNWANAWVWDHKYWLRTSYPTGIPELVLVYDFRTRTWEYHDSYPRGFCAFTYYGNQLIGTVDRSLMVLETGTDDWGTPITATYRTGRIAPAGPTVQHLYHALYLQVKGTGTMTVTLTVDATVRTRTITLTPDFKEWRLEINAPGKWLDVAVSGTAWEALSPATVEYYPLDLGRSSR